MASADTDNENTKRDLTYSLAALSLPHTLSRTTVVGCFALEVAIVICVQTAASYVYRNKKQELEERRERRRRRRQTVYRQPLFVDRHVNKRPRLEEDTDKDSDAEIERKLDEYMEDIFDWLIPWGEEQLEELVRGFLGVALGVSSPSGASTDAEAERRLENHMELIRGNYRAWAEETLGKEMRLAPDDEWSEQIMSNLDGYRERLRDYFK